MGVELKIKLMLAAVLVAFGCTSLGFGIRERAETAFRLQNHLSSEFMLAALEIESKEPTTYESLLVMEALMLDACRPLNILASKRYDNESADYGEKRAIKGSLEGCEQATSNFGESLQQTQQRMPEL